MEKQRCKDCKNFRKHYIKYVKGPYHALNYGHCILPHKSKRFMEDEACVYFMQATPDCS